MPTERSRSSRYTFSPLSLRCRPGTWASSTWRIALGAAAAPLAHVLVVRRLLLVELLGLALFDALALSGRFLLFPVVAPGAGLTAGPVSTFVAFLLSGGGGLRVVRHALLIHPLVDLALGSQAARPRARSEDRSLTARRGEA
jgi:hypothetical protein